MNNLDNFYKKVLELFSILEKEHNFTCEWGFYGNKEDIFLSLKHNSFEHICIVFYNQIVNNYYTNKLILNFYGNDSLNIIQNYLLKNKINFKIIDNETIELF